MMLHWLIITVLIHNSLALGLYDDIDDYHLWRRGGPSIPTKGSDCRKDILVLWDNSWSVGSKYFNEFVRPFLIDLIKSPQLNVGPSGTHIGFMTFATQVKTRVLLKVGENQTKDDLIKYLNGLNYKPDLDGDGTRTGYAFMLAATKLFTQKSPFNHRPDVDDVILLFTDGQPTVRTNPDWKPKPEDRFGFRSEKAMAKKYSKDLKDNGVRIVGLAVGTEEQLRQFTDDIMEWSSPDLTFTTDLENLNAVENKLVKASCIGPGACDCDTVVAQAYTAPGQSQVQVSWQKPEFECQRNPIGLVETVSPNIRSPAMFKQDTTIAYEYSYKIGSTRASTECYVEIIVGACECSIGDQKVTGKIRPGTSQAYVTWTEPTVSCPVTSHRSNPSSPNGRYSVGKHTELYEFTASTGDRSFNVYCRVNIEVTGELCNGKSFNPQSQACCCGKVYPKLRGYKCCGMNYYHTVKKMCCDEKRANVVPRGANCP